MQWIYLSLAIIFEVLGTISMKLSNGFTKTCSKYFIVIVLYRQPLFSYFDFEIYKCLHRVCGLVGNGDRADFHDRNFFLS
ncbi:Small Multidrug Resistance (SMR) protein [Bacillus sp. VMFN-A1]|nr:Small Multidrug Resistance (SMR) protein [Bacillus sp. VMFN-A1]